MKTSVLRKLQDSLREELTRSIQRLRAPGHPKPYYISYLLRDIDHYIVWACYGSICNNRRDKRRNCYVDVRVGSYKYDQTSKGGLTDNNDEAESVELIDMPIEDNKDALRFALWRLTDSKYREAVKDFHAKKSRDVSFLDVHKGTPSFKRQESVISEEKLSRMTLDQPAFEKLVRDASMVFKDFPEIKNSYVEFSGEMQTKIFLSSEGVERTWQELVYRLQVYMWFHSPECNIERALVFNVSSLDEIPTAAKLKKEIKKKLAENYKIEKGDRINSYTGPVLLAPQPAGLFIHEVVGHRLEGSRLLSDEEGKTLKDKVGEKIMHADISIYDDPTLKIFDGKSLIGSFAYDDEGTKATRATLVHRGILKGFLTSRSPISQKSPTNNGHARNQSFERPTSRMGNLLVESHSQKSWAKLKAMLVDEVKNRKLPYGIILLEVEGGEAGTEAYNFQAFLGQITTAVKVFPDGREVYIKGVDFVGTPLASLSHIIAVGKDLVVDNGFCGAESGTLPVSTIAPALLLSTLELQAKEPNKVTQYSLPLPWCDEDS